MATHASLLSHKDGVDVKEKDIFLHVEDPPFRGRSGSAPPPGAAPSPDGADIKQGCTILGAGLALRPRYVTRFCIDRNKQRDLACKDGMRDACSPCLKSETYRLARLFIWTVISSNPFLIACHLLSLLLGVIKLAHAYHHTSLKFSGFLTAMETLLVIAVVIIRVIQANNIYSALRGDLSYLQLLPRAESKLVLSVRYYAHSFTGVGIALLVINIVVLLTLGSIQDIYAHIGWSILCNQIVLVAITYLSISYQGLFDTYTHTLHADAHRVVLFEALLLLREAHSNMRSHEIQRDVMSVGVHVATNDTKDKLARFLRALYGTEIFKNPDYVTCPGWLDNQTDLLNAITSLEPLNGASPDFRKLSQIQL